MEQGGATMQLEVLGLQTMGEIIWKA
jgi:hypothetical protein